MAGKGGGRAAKAGDVHPTCCMPRCKKPTWNDQWGEKCSKSCTGGPGGAVPPPAPTCTTQGCNKPTWNGMAGETCSRSCSPMVTAAVCITPGCGKPTWNGKPGSKCGKSCGSSHGQATCATPKCGKPTWNGMPGKCLNSCGSCMTKGCSNPSWNGENGQRCDKLCGVCATPGCSKPSCDGRKGSRCNERCGWAICATEGCAKYAYNGKQGERCRKGCGTAICATTGCGKPSWNGVEGSTCSKGCDGKPKCEASGCGKPTWNGLPGKGGEPGVCGKTCLAALKASQGICAATGCGKPAYQGVLGNRCCRYCISQAPADGHAQGHEALKHSLQLLESLQVVNESVGQGYSNIFPDLQDVICDRSLVVQELAIAYCKTFEETTRSDGPIRLPIAEGIHFGSDFAHEIPDLTALAISRAFAMLPKDTRTHILTCTVKMCIPEAATFQAFDKWLAMEAIRLSARAPSSFYDTDGPKLGWRVRNFTYRKLTMREAFRFEDHEWNNYFIDSITNLCQEFYDPGVGPCFQFLQCHVLRSELDQAMRYRITVKDNGRYPKNMSANQKIFGSKLHDDNRPAFFDASLISTKPESQNNDLVMISPGKAGGDRCRDLVKFMSSPQTMMEEKVDLWRKVGQVTLARMEGQLIRRAGKFDGRMCNMDAKGWDHLEVSTHGFGVPWLHVRVESDPQYDPVNGVDGDPVNGITYFRPGWDIAKYQ